MTRGANIRALYLEQVADKPVLSDDDRKALRQIADWLREQARQQKAEHETHFGRRTGGLVGGLRS